MTSGYDFLPHTSPHFPTLPSLRQIAGLASLHPDRVKLWELRVEAAAAASSEAGGGGLQFPRVLTPVAAAAGDAASGGGGGGRLEFGHYGLSAARALGMPECVLQVSSRGEPKTMQACAESPPSTRRYASSPVAPPSP